MDKIHGVIRPPPDEASDGRAMDITQLILDDHHEQRRLFARLEQIDRTDTAALSAVWTRLAAFLEVHAEAEEQLFYPELLRVGKGVDSVSPQAETVDAIGDHNDIRDAVAVAADHEVGSDGWYDAVAGANEANSDHMAEEEREAPLISPQISGYHRLARPATAAARQRPRRSSPPRPSHARRGAREMARPAPSAAARCRARRGLPQSRARPQ